VSNFFIEHGGFWVVICNYISFVFFVSYFSNEIIKTKKTIFYKNKNLDILAITFNIAVLFYVIFNLINLLIEKIFAGNDYIMKLLYQIY